MTEKKIIEEMKLREEMINSLQSELAETNKGLMALTMELEDRVDERTAELAESEKRHRTLFDNAVSAIITIDERGTIESMNKAGIKLFGYAVNEVLGKNVKMLMPGQDSKDHDKYLKSYRDTGIKKIIGIGREVTGKQKDGKLFPLELAVSEIVIDDRKFFTGIITDITEQKAYAEILEAQIM